MGSAGRCSPLRLIPSLETFGDVNSGAELRVARLLDQIESPTPAVALYSIHLPRHEYKRMSEIDFLVVYDDVALVIEVKGGRIGRRDGLWTFTDRFGDTNEKREGPFDQARSAMFSLEKRLQHDLPRLDVAFGYLVVTPDQDLGRDLEWDPQTVAGPSSMSVTGLSAALDAARRYWLGKRSRKPRGGGYAELLAALRPDFDLVPSLRSHVGNLENEFVRLADRQYDLLVGAERNHRIVCTGGAGSGKTLLAVETARRAAASGQDVLLTCRSPALAALLCQALEGTSAECLAFDKIGDRPPCDVLVVDEAQDLMDVASYLALDSQVKGGWDSGRWRVFCDANNQANVDGNFERSTFDELVKGAMVVELPFNCRNTATVVQQTQLVTGADLGVARAGQGPPVQYEQPSDDLGTARLLDAHLKRLRQHEVAPSDIAVITLRSDAADSSAVLSKAYGAHKLKIADPVAHSQGYSLLCTAADIKGLEAAHVCVVDVHDVEDVHERARLYVAMTRARISLWIALSPTAWDQVARGTQRGGT